MSTTLASAIAFARHGLAVLPLTWPMLVNDRRQCSCKKAADCPSAAKHPLGRLVPRGLLDASTDEAVIRKWFVDEPPANLGLRTDQLVVLDADPRHGGDETLADLEHANPFPLTWRVLTGGGGEHVIFKCPDGVTINSTQAETNPLLGAGIDVRAQHGYIVAPPSRHISGRAYAWNVDFHPRDVALAEAPTWLIERVAERAIAASNRTPDSEWERICAQPVTSYQDAAAAKLAGRLLRYHDPGAVLGLMQCWNAMRCKPPLAESALYQIVNRIAGLELRRREARDGG
jgi:hypothetical protein